MKRRPIGLLAISALNVLLGLGSFAYGARFGFSGGLYVAISGVALVAGVGLFLLKEWGRWLALLVAGLLGAWFGLNMCAALMWGGLSLFLRPEGVIYGGILVYSGFTWRYLLRASIKTHLQCR